MNNCYFYSIKIVLLFKSCEKIPNAVLLLVRSLDIFTQLEHYILDQVIG